MKLKVVCSIGLVGAKIVDYVELPDDWDEMGESAREAWSQGELDVHVANWEDHYYELVEEEDE